ncbi:MAG TPA: TetR/AcrR family transcriptional regulator [Terracidiphilus sp.]|jgi:TetR/AcrR family transcriptional repressor of nem operon|nr:TetR/AcrR family transcriptional regulator [Terracidiphilus sp.]
MRYPVEQKAETHDRIIEAAARSFREHGSEGQGVAGLMKEAGLTHGGFYRHFTGKDDLYVDAIARGFQQTADKMIMAAARAPHGEQLRTIIERYLSMEHLEDPGGGCVLSTLAAEIARQRPAVRARINAVMKSYRERLLPFLPGRDDAEKRCRFMVLFPSMAGVLMTARAMTDPAARKEILSAARRFYISAFAQQSSR